MILPFLFGDNRWSQWLNHIVFNDLWQIPKFCCDFCQKPAYEIWEQQDQVLVTWLQSTLSTPILSWMLGCVHSYEVWECIHKYFHNQTKATTRQLRTQLRSTTLGTKSMREFLSHLRVIADSLASVGSPIMLQEHVSMILEGLSSEYHSVIAIIESKFETQPLEQVEALLLAHVARLSSHLLNLPRSTSRTCKQPISCTRIKILWVSLTSAVALAVAVPMVITAAASVLVVAVAEVVEAAASWTSNFNCYKYGHTAYVCHYWFETNYQPSSSLVLHDPTPWSLYWQKNL